MVDTSKESLCINKLVCEREETLFLEEDIIVPDSKPDILSAINTSGNICIYKKEIIDEKLKIDGNINACVMYLADNVQDNVRGIEVSLDFSKNLNAPNCKPDMLLDTNIQIKSINCSVINGRKINVKVEVSVAFRVYANEDVEIINDVINNENIQILKDRVKVNSLVGSGNTKAYVKDTMMIDDTDSLAEILKININMIDKDIKTSYNKVLAKAEAEIKIMYLTEDNRISTVTNRIPVVGFIDIQNVSEDNVCDTNFEIRNMVIKPNNAEEHSIYVELEAEVSCMAYEEKDINLIQDLYSPLEEISCSRKQITTISNKQNRMENCHVNGTVNLPDLGENGLIDGSCTPRITNINKLNSRVMYGGELETNFVFINLNNQINTVTSNVPFEFAVDNIENGEMLNVSTNMEIGSQDFIVKSGGDVSIDVNVIFNMGMSKCENLEIIDNIELTQDLSMEDYSLIIYIVKKGDTLWNIAKKLNSTVDDIVRANEIEDENMINVGEKLYIPKYVKKGVAKQIERPVVANYA